MTADNPAEMEGYLLPSEFHSLVLSLYPPLVNCEYEICRASGANHTAVVPLDIPEGSSSGMYWCPDRLKPIIKRRTKIIVRPLTAIDIGVLQELPVSS